MTDADMQVFNKTPNKSPFASSVPYCHTCGAEGVELSQGDHDNGIYCNDCIDL
jgi:hypothetical protein